MRVELGGKTLKRIVGSRLKSSSYIADDYSEGSKAKSTKNASSKQNLNLRGNST